MVDKIINREAFDDVLKNMYKKDRKTADNIETSLRSLVKDSHNILKARGQTKEKIKIALLEEKLNMQAYSSQYLNVCDKLANFQQTLYKKAPLINEAFFDDVFDKLDVYFEDKKEKMFKEIRQNVHWFSGFVDAAKKGGSLYNGAVKGINKVADVVKGSSLNLKEVDDKNLVEVVLEKYLKADMVSRDIAQIMQDSSENYKKGWAREISVQMPDMKGLKVLDPLKGSVDMNVGLQFGATEQALLLGMGSAVVGTLGLAAGWHTITYAFLNVFPPIAVFAVFMTMVTGIATVNNEIERRQKQISEVVNQYYRTFIIDVDKRQLKELGGLTLRKYIINTSESIVGDTVKRLSAVYLGKLDVQDIRMLCTAITRHIVQIDEALEKM